MISMSSFGLVFIYFLLMILMSSLIWVSGSSEGNIDFHPHDCSISPAYLQNVVSMLKSMGIGNACVFQFACILRCNINRVLSDRQNREKSGNLVDREKSGKRQGI